MKTLGKKFGFVVGFGSLTVLALSASHAAEIAADTAADPAYESGWHDGVNGGSGFRGWTLRSSHGEGDSYAGSFIATPTDNHDTGLVSTDGSAFGLYANGTVFEESAAFREFAEPLSEGKTFSFTFRNGQITPKYESDDAATGAVGLVLRSGNATEKPSDYNAGARIEFGFFEGDLNYKLVDGGGSEDTGIPVAVNGSRIEITLTGPDTYNLKFTDLETGDEHFIEDRKLAGDEGAPVDSFALYNRDGEINDVFFNNLKVVDGP